MELLTLIEKLLPIWDLIKEDCLCMYLSGSESLPYINNKHDIDVIYVYKTKRQGIDLRIKLFFEDENKNLINELKQDRIALLGVDVEKENEIKIWSHIKPILLFGEYSEELIPHDLVLNYQSDFLREVKKNIDIITKKYNEKGIIKKSLYHCLVIMYYIKNNTYDLTQEQIENINMVHDQKEENTEIIYQLYLQVKSWIESYGL